MVFQSSIKNENLIKSRTIGTGEASGLKDGNFEEATFNEPIGICLLSNKAIGFVTDCKHNCIRMIDFGEEKIITIAGDKNGFSGHQDGNSQNSLFYSPKGIAIHKNQNLLFVSDCWNHVIRQIDISSIEHQTKTQPKNDPDELEFELLVSTVCGKPEQAGFEDGVGSEAKLNLSTGLAFSELDETVLYFCDAQNQCIRKVNVLTKQVSTIAGIPKLLGFKDGIGNEAQFRFPYGICVDKNESLFVCDFWNHSIRKITFKPNPNQSNQSNQSEQIAIVTTIFGNPINEGAKDGNQSTATLNFPNSISFDRISNCLIFTQENSIRQIKLGKSFLEWKLKRIFLIYRILFKQCEKSISKRLLLQLISIQILQTSSENRSDNKTITEKEKKIIEYIKSDSNLNFLNSKRSYLLENIH